MLYRISIKAAISSSRTPQLVRRYSSQFASITGAFINLIVIIVLNSLYERLAIWLTDYGKNIDISIIGHFIHILII